MTRNNSSIVDGDYGCCIVLCCQDAGRFSLMFTWLPGQRPFAPAAENKHYSLLFSQYSRCDGATLEDHAKFHDISSVHATA